MSAVTVRVERSGPAVRAALAEFAPGECARFESEVRQALAAAGEDLDLARVEAVLDRWWGIAAIRANPLSETERELVAQARAGDYSGWIVHDPGRDDSQEPKPRADPAVHA